MKNNAKIVTIGGGTGAPIIIQALLLAGFKNIQAICASTDSGGKTGVIRSDERDRVIAVTDLLRNLLALIPPAKSKEKNVAAFYDLIGYTDGRNRNLGYTIYYALLEKYHNDYKIAQKHIEQLLKLRFWGTAIPVSQESTHLCFRTISGDNYVGEHELDRQAMSKNTIQKIWLNPSVSATPEAVKAIASADYLIYAPGSLYGSILANFLPLGIGKALGKSKAIKILIPNLSSNRNQTHHITPLKYWQIFQKYTGLKKPFNLIITPDSSQKKFEKKYPSITQKYSLEQSHFIGWNDKQLKPVKKLGVEIITGKIYAVTPQLLRLRHSPPALSKIFKKIFFN